MTPKPKPKNYSKILDMLNTPDMAKALTPKTYINIVGEYSKKALDHIAANKISIATSEASWHKGEALNESRARWQKLAGILKD